ncbi:MAG TPA: hypothetical protein VFE51_30695 [Verrucomicrobiae bacterium]|nr:hypothetical protein [Verrucomicrobiae bacterium]
MSRIIVKGAGAVSPAGWGAAALTNALERGTPLPIEGLAGPAPGRPLRVRRVPVANPKPAFTAHPRLRRTSPIGQFAVAAALEAIGPEPGRLTENGARLGIVYCSMAGCVNFSRRFYDETLKNPSTASPVIFPETVFNSPASHLGALLGTQAIDYTLVGDPGTFLQGVALAAGWLDSGRVDNCLVIGAEELDWLVANAAEMFHSESIVGEGAGALLLCGSANGCGIELQAVTSSYPFSSKLQRAAAAIKARDEARPDVQNTLLCDSTQAVARLDSDEIAAWSDWPGPRISPKRICGESFMAAAAWQCVAAVQAVASGRFASAQVSVVGCNQQAIAARFGKQNSDEGRGTRDEGSARVD